MSIFLTYGLFVIHKSKVLVEKSGEAASVYSEKKCDNFFFNVAF
jgi:hypothetical protein